jgi:protein TonB
MKTDFSNIARILFFLFSLQKANGQELNSISVENKNVSTQSRVSCKDSNYYPRKSMRLEQEGIVTLAIAIDSKGKFIAAKINRTSGFERLDAAALDNIKDCIFYPRIIDNKAVESINKLDMVFLLEDSRTSIETLRAKRDQYPETPNDKVDEILEAGLREATESRLKQEKEASESQAKKEKEDAEYQVWLRTSEGKKFLADKAMKEKKEMAGRELEAKKVEEQARQERINFAKKYPFYAIVTCTGGGRQFNTSSCLAGKVESKVKVGNSTSHHLLPILALGKETRAGLVINLLSVFELKFQNSSEMDNLNVKIFNSLTNEVIYFKSTGLYGVIAVKNCIRKTNVKDSKNLPLPKDSIGACDA